jgi:hypothetical protein
VYFIADSKKKQFLLSHFNEVNEKKNGKKRFFETNHKIGE